MHEAHPQLSATLAAAVHNATPLHCMAYGTTELMIQVRGQPLWRWQEEGVTAEGQQKERHEGERQQEEEQPGGKAEA
jgi:hypothetical protein